MFTKNHWFAYIFTYFSLSKNPFSSCTLIYIVYIYIRIPSIYVKKQTEFSRTARYHNPIILALNIQRRSSSSSSSDPQVYVNISLPAAPLAISHLIRLTTFLLIRAFYRRLYIIIIIEPSGSFRRSAGAIMVLSSVSLSLPRERRDCLWPAHLPR